MANILQVTTPNMDNRNVVNAQDPKHGAGNPAILPEWSVQTDGTGSRWAKIPRMLF